ncbi:LysR family transcriptional regulator [Flavisphingomonas formosensis]|uniref:LysR family transcriptional regulator n=1 Tax=Flavisphingomonas formosensis TaxID=861534 RepID=UPI0018E02BCF|nr:LysR family transcriptional regulator [Sphingomonas formosensis]
MNIRSLRYFMKVAEYGNVTRAAADLHLTQPALTRHIALLEDELQAKLLMRHGRGVQLTEAGRLVIERAGILIAQIEDLADELAARETEPQGELSVGLPYAFSQIAVEVLSRFRELHPAVRVRCIIDSSETLEGMLKSHYIDAAVLTMLEDDAEIETRVLANDNQFLLGPRESDLKDLDHVPMTELAHRPIIRQHNATVSLKRMSQKLSRHGLAVNTVIQTSSSMLLDLVEAGQGYVVMPGCALTLRGHNVQAVRIEGLTTVWTFGRLKTRPRTAAIDVFDNLLREVIKPKVASGEWPAVTLVDV